MANWHTVVDSLNVIELEYRDPDSTDALLKSTNRCLEGFSRHMTNDLQDSDGTPGGIGSGTWHQGGGANDDIGWANTTKFKSVSELAEVHPALCDLHRAYEAHRVDDGHEIAGGDVFHPLVALEELSVVYSTFFGELNKANPTAPTTANAGATQLAHELGFVEEDL